MSMGPSDEDATVLGIAWSQNEQNWSSAWYEKEKAGKAHGLQDVFNSYLTSVHSEYIIIAVNI